MKSPVIMVVGVNGRVNHELTTPLTLKGFVISNVPENNAFLSFLENKPDLIILNTARQTQDSLDLVRRIRNLCKTVPIILIASHSSEDQAISAIKAGVTDYFKAPSTSGEIAMSIERHLSFLSSFPVKTPEKSCWGHTQDLVGESDAVKAIRGYIEKVAATDSTVLITGETGTGKEVVAEQIHRQSPRHNGGFVCVNCSALPESLIESELFGYAKGAFTGAVGAKQGSFELAKGGTLFLDEIGDMSLNAQAKILRAIEKKEIHRLGGKVPLPTDIRLVAATNQNVEQLSSDGKFRKDLYFRLNVARIHIQPLRERKNDIPCLIAHFIRQLNKRFERDIESFSEKANHLLIGYHWPGNVRELKNIVEASFINLPSAHTSFMELPLPLKTQIETMKPDVRNERIRIVSALIEAGWNKSRAAKKLNCSRMTVYRKMEQYDIAEKRM